MRRNVFLKFWFVAAILLLSGQSVLAESLRKAVFVRGFDAASCIGNSKCSFKRVLTSSLSNHKSEFFKLGHNQDRLLKSMIRASGGIYYFSGHAGTINGVQGLLVRPSRGNRNRTSSGKYVTLAPDIQTALEGREKPRLVIMNGCELTKPNDGVPQEKRISYAFGITSQTRGRAFIGWSYPVFGRTQDGFFAKVLHNWATKRQNGQPITIEQAVAMTPSNVQPPVIIGDRQLRYR